MTKGKLPFYKRFPGDFLMATRELTLEERGAYNDCLELMYDRGRPIPDEEKWLSGFLGISPRKWRTIRQALLDAGKLHLKGDYLSNARFERDRQAEMREHDQAVKWGRMGGKRRAEEEAKRRQTSLDFEPENGGKEPAKPKAPLPADFDDEEDENGQEKGLPGQQNGASGADFSSDSARFGEQKASETSPHAAKIKDLAQGPLKPARETIFQSLETPRLENNHLPLVGAKTPKPKPSRKKAQNAKPMGRWEPAPIEGELAHAIVPWGPERLARELDKFRDWASANGTTSKDWNARWRNWLRKALENDERSGSRHGSKAGWAALSNR